MFQIGTCGICSINHVKVLSGGEKHQSAIRVEHAISLLSAGCPVHHQAQLFSSSKSGVQVVVFLHIYWGKTALMQISCPQALAQGMQYFNEHELWVEYELCIKCTLFFQIYAGESCRNEKFDLLYGN